MNDARSPTQHDDDIDAFIAAIRREALLQGDSRPFADRTDDLLRMRSEAIAARHDVKVARSLEDWMPLHGERFVASAYQTLLKREVDPAGLANFAGQLQRGRLTRWQVAGLLRLSPEGRTHAVHVKRLWLGFALATIYRVPIAGPLVSFLATTLRIPAYLQDLSGEDRLIAQLLVSAH